MKVIDKLNKMHNNTDIFDTGLTKWYVFFFTLFLVKFYPVLLSLDWYTYLILAIIFAVRPVSHFLSKSKK